MSVFKNLKSIFIVEGDKGKTVQENKSADTSSQQTTPESSDKGSGEPIHASRAFAGEGHRDDKIIDALFKALEKSNRDGFDYLEFKQAVKGLEKMVTEEDTRYKSAFATVSTMGITLNNLVESAAHYISVLDREKSEFVKTAGEQTKSLVENRKKEIQALLQEMAGKKALIDKLTAELAQSETRLKNIQDGIDNAAVKIEQTKKNFDVSFSYLRDQIATDVEKMKNYLK